MVGDLLLRSESKFFRIKKQRLCCCSVFFSCVCQAFMPWSWLQLPLLHDSYLSSVSRCSFFMRKFQIFFSSSSSSSLRARYEGWRGTQREENWDFVKWFCYHLRDEVLRQQRRARKEKVKWLNFLWWDWVRATRLISADENWSFNIPWSLWDCWPEFSTSLSSESRTTLSSARREINSLSRDAENEWCQQFVIF